MTTPTLPPISTLPSLPTTTRVSILDTLFEPSVPLHTLSIDLLHSTPFPSYADLIASIGVQLTDLLESASSSDTEWLDSILGAHPRLGEKKVESVLSRGEQAAMVGVSRVGQGEAEREEAELKGLNEEYERVYPGLRYVVFVNGRPRSVIMEDMRRRIARNNIDAERRDAIKAMCDIAADRARKLGS